MCGHTLWAIAHHGTPYHTVISDVWAHSVSHWAVPTTASRCCLRGACMDPGSMADHHMLLCNIFLLQTWTCTIRGLPGKLHRTLQPPPPCVCAIHPFVTPLCLHLQAEAEQQQLQAAVQKIAEGTDKLQQYITEYFTPREIDDLHNNDEWTYINNSVPQRCLLVHEIKIAVNELLPLRRQ